MYKQRDQQDEVAPSEIRYCWHTIVISKIEYSLDDLYKLGLTQHQKLVYERGLKAFISF